MTRALTKSSSLPGPAGGWTTASGFALAAALAASCGLDPIEGGAAVDDTAPTTGDGTHLAHRGPQAAQSPRLLARAVLPAATFAPGPVSGQFIGSAPINGIT